MIAERMRRLLELATDDEDLDSVRAARRKLSADHRQLLNHLEAELPSQLLARWRLLIRSKHQASKPEKPKGVKWQTFFGNFMKAGKEALQVQLSHDEHTLISNLALELDEASRPSAEEEDFKPPVGFKLVEVDFQMEAGSPVTPVSPMGKGAPAPFGTSPMTNPSSPGVRAPAAAHRAILRADTRRNPLG